MTRADVFARVMEVGIIPAIRPSTTAEAVHAAEAICRGGIPIVEISMAMPEAAGSLEAVNRIVHGKILTGAGSVVDAEGVRRAVASGARFIVTPGFSREAVDAAHRANVPIFAGALTPTEVQVALLSGADAVKLFPCYASGGPRYLRSLLAQYPGVQLIASGGVTLENCIDYIRAGAAAVGIGNEIGDSTSMAAGDHRLFTERARRFVRAVREGKTLRNNGRLPQAG